ncbi:MAG: TetR/AcrR family transcriptional regulator [Micromonosporaceae bacterium]
MVSGERPVTQARADATTAIMDAAERLLVEVGYAGITTRKLADEAGVNAALIHYYFGSMEEVFLQVLERFTARLTERQAAMYAGDAPFAEKWRTAMRYLFEDRASGYQKIVYELFAMSWNKPEMRARVARFDERWTEIVADAVAGGMRELGIDTRRFPVKAVTCLVISFNKGIMLDGLTGFDNGHAELLDMIDRFLVRLERERKKGTS